MTDENNWEPVLKDLEKLGSDSLQQVQSDLENYTPSFDKPRTIVEPTLPEPKFESSSVLNDVVDWHDTKEDLDTPKDPLPEFSISDALESIKEDSISVEDMSSAELEHVISETKLPSELPPLEDLIDDSEVFVAETLVVKEDSVELISDEPQEPQVSSDTSPPENKSFYKPQSKGLAVSAGWGSPKENIAEKDEVLEEFFQPKYPTIPSGDSRSQVSKYYESNPPPEYDLYSIIQILGTLLLVIGVIAWKVVERF